MIAEDKTLVQRVTLSAKEQEQSLSLTDTFTEELKQFRSLHEKRTSILSDIVSPFLPAEPTSYDRATEAVKTLEQFHAEEFERRRSKLKEFTGNSEVITAYKLHVDRRLSISGPPYDAEQTGGTISYAHKDNGEFGISPMAGFAWAGVAINVTTTENTIGLLTAYVPIEYSWTNFVSGAGSASCYGGISTRVFDLTNAASPVINVSGPLWSNAQYGNGVQSDPGSSNYLSYTSAAETYFPFFAGHVYQIWVWCWGGTAMQGNAFSFASINCKMPFMVIRPTHL